MHAHMNRPNSSLEWVLSHRAHFTVLRFIVVYVLLLACDTVRWTWWDYYYFLQCFDTVGWVT